MIDVMIATMQGRPDGGPDDALLAAAIRAEGGSVAIAGWDDPAVDWRQAGTIVVRSTWNYHLAPHAWRDWVALATSSSRLLNPAKLILWNMDKRYLCELAGLGLAVVPTRLVAPDQPEQVSAQASWEGWTDVVVKPAIAASAFGARRFRLPAERNDLMDHAALLAASGSILVQPYQKRLEKARERSLVFINGQFSHAYDKPAFMGTLDGRTAPLQLVKASRAELRLANAVLAMTSSLPLMARVDVVPGAPCATLMELELIEPHLALDLHPPAAAMLARAILG
jgi:hypothetical protein